jgi:membrane-associated protease RseP (regulator of RpoE activity)
MNRSLRLFVLAPLLFLSGCLSYYQRPAPLGHTTFSGAVANLPAEAFGNILVVRVKWDKYGPYHFLVDTGSSVTLVTPELADRYRDKEAPELPGVSQVEVQSGASGAVILPTAVLEKLDLGAAHFARVPVVVYDCAPLTAQLGIKIDGILGFPLFNKTLLTLDYRHSRVLIRPNSSLAALRPYGTQVPFNDADTIPLISVQLGDRRFFALIDSGSDSALSLNPSGLAPKFVFGPVQGPTVGTLAGDRTRQVGRLAQTLVIGDYSVVEPVTEISDELSAIGGGILKNFTVTFDQRRGEATFYRDSGDPVTTPGMTGTGLSFGKTPAYWRVVGVVPGSPADLAGIETGDLVTRINGDPVPKWSFHRFEGLIASAHDVVLTFLNGTVESNKTVAVVPLVP